MSHFILCLCPPRCILGRLRAAQYCKNVDCRLNLISSDEGHHWVVLAKCFGEASVLTDKWNLKLVTCSHNGVKTNKMQTTNINLNKVQVDCGLNTRLLGNYKVSTADLSFYINKQQNSFLTAKLSVLQNDSCVFWKGRVGPNGKIRVTSQSKHREKMPN